MSVRERITHRRRADDVALSTRATCLRCRREYTPDPDARENGAYCWWCAAHLRRDARPAVPE